MATLSSAQSLGALTLAELRELIRQVVREEGFSPWRSDDEGNRVFLREADYVLYLDARSDKLPSEVNAFFIDHHGFTARYSDEVARPNTRRRMQTAKRALERGKGLSFETVKRRLASR